MRYKEYNTNAVLEQCIHLFWNHGYNACSINAIVKKTRVNRFSLYEEFGDKQGILKNALEQYRNRLVHKKMEILEESRSVKDVIADFYHSFLPDHKDHPPGCFILHIATELADTEDWVKDYLDSFLRELEENFKKVLDKDVQLKKKKDFIATHLVALYCSVLCFCVIQPEGERKFAVKNNLNLILKKEASYA